MSSPTDPYSRLHYRRVIAWPQRIERERGLLEEVLGSGPTRRVLDLGCGTGEHSRFLSAQGFEVVGLDRSEAMLEEARRDPLPENLRFVEVDLGRLDELAPENLGGAFGGAICLGNTLPHLTERDELVRMSAGLRRLLLPGAPLVLQIVNYERIFARRERHLPLNLRPDEDGEGEIVFLRLLELHDDGFVTFCPTTLRFRPEAEPVVEVISSRSVRLRGWRRGEIEEILAAAGFAERELLGGFDRRAYDPEGSPDLLLVAR